MWTSCTEVMLCSVLTSYSAPRDKAPRGCNRPSVFHVLRLGRG